MTEDDRRAVYIIAAQKADGAFPQGVVRNHAEERAVHPQIGKRQRDVGFASAVTGFKTVGNTDLPVIGRGQPQHDLSEGDKLMPHLVRDWIFMNHDSALLSAAVWQRVRSADIQME